ncbi:hypothetical protein M0802_005696 [Mischocyttarus mexicanus]|nr:hypothetical protein M0802_005696 [Mischocyttarus mexicanus]
MLGHFRVIPGGQSAAGREAPFAPLKTKRGIEGGDEGGSVTAVLRGYRVYDGAEGSEAERGLRKNWGLGLGLGLG